MHRFFALLLKSVVHMKAMPAVNLDPERISEVVINLVENALAVCEEGDSVNVSAGRYPARQGFVLIEVADISLGIPGYVTSLPQKTSDAPVVERDPGRAPWRGPVK